jgi:hypothetical protein
MKDLFDLLGQVAPTDATVLILVKAAREKN